MSDLARCKVTVWVKGRSLPGSLLIRTADNSKPCWNSGANSLSWWSPDSFIGAELSSPP